MVSLSHFHNNLQPFCMQPQLQSKISLRMLSKLARKTWLKRRDVGGGNSGCSLDGRGCRLIFYPRCGFSIFVLISMNGLYQL